MRVFGGVFLNFSERLLIGFDMKLFKQARRYGAQLAAGTSALAFSALASAQTVTTDPISTILASVDLSGIAIKVAAAALVVVVIALTFKGPDVAKRVIRKV